MLGDRQIAGECPRRGALFGNSEPRLKLGELVKSDRQILCRPNSPEYSNVGNGAMCVEDR